MLTKRNKRQLARELKKQLTRELKNTKTIDINMEKNEIVETDEQIKNREYEL